MGIVLIRSNAPKRSRRPPGETRPKRPDDRQGPRPKASTKFRSRLVIVLDASRGKWALLTNRDFSAFLRDNRDGRPTAGKWRASKGRQGSHLANAICRDTVARRIKEAAFLTRA